MGRNNCCCNNDKHGIEEIKEAACEIERAIKALEESLCEIKEGIRMIECD